MLTWETAKTHNLEQSALRAGHVGANPDHIQRETWDDEAAALAHVECSCGTEWAWKLTPDAVTMDARYTIAEASQMLAARRCAEYGHAPTATFLPLDKDEAQAFLAATPDARCDCGLVAYIRLTAAMPEQLAGEAP